MLSQNTQFVSQDNQPPSIHVPTTALRPTNRVLVLLRDDLNGSADGGTGSSIRLEAQIRDPDVLQELRFRLYVDYRDRQASDVPLTTIAATGQFSRPFSVDVPSGLLSEPGCHRIELVVTSAFANDRDRTPLVPGDVDVMTWWVATRASEVSTVDMTGCANL